MPEPRSHPKLLQSTLYTSVLICIRVRTTLEYETNASGTRIGNVGGDIIGIDVKGSGNIIGKNLIIETEQLNDCYKYSVAINSHAETHPFPSESLIMALLLTQHKLIDQLKSMMPSKQIHF